MYVYLYRSEELFKIIPHTLQHLSIDFVNVDPLTIRLRYFLFILDCFTEGLGEIGECYWKISQQNQMLQFLFLPVFYVLVFRRTGLVSLITITQWKNHYPQISETCCCIKKWF